MNFTDRVQCLEEIYIGSGRKFEKIQGLMIEVQLVDFSSSFLSSPYGLYETIDFVYGPATFKRGEGFTSAQAVRRLSFQFERLLGRSHY